MVYEGRRLMQSKYELRQTVSSFIFNKMDGQLPQLYNVARRQARMSIYNNLLVRTGTRQRGYENALAQEIDDD